MTEELIMGYLPLAGALFMLGGYKWKWVRRWGLPIITLAFLLLCGVQQWQAWTAENPIPGENVYRVRIPVPPELIVPFTEDAEIVRAPGA